MSLGDWVKKTVGGAVRSVFGSLQKERDLRRARGVPTEGIRTVCLALGPYRNLTTLTASTLFLHPHCQVLNHAGGRILGDARLDFLQTQAAETYRAFVRYAVFISGSGSRGDFGGSIVHSHAFDGRYPMRQAFERSGNLLIKRDIRALFWKESLLMSNRIRSLGIDVAKLLERFPALRFLQPIRDPLACARSNLATGHYRRFEGMSRSPALAEVLTAVLREHAWFLGLAERNPDRFFSFFGYETDRGTLATLTRFLGLEPEDDWLDLAAPVFAARPEQASDREDRAMYREKVEEILAVRPEAVAAFLRFGD